VKIDYEYGKVHELDPMTIEFNDFLKSLGVAALFTKYSGTNYLSIWVFSIDDVRRAKEIVKSNFRQIIAHFKNLLAKYNYPTDFEKEIWSDFSVSSIYSFEIACVSDLVRRRKQQIIDKVNHELKIKPEYIFCHSEDEQSYSIMPGYNFIYSDPEKLSRSSDNDQDKIKIICDKILKANDKSGLYTLDNIQISFFDKVTSASSMYGMSRED
jgi:hypothetical protein